MDKALTSAGDPSALAEVRGEVKRFTSHFPLPG